MGANEQAWKDFSEIIGILDQIKKDVKRVGQNIERLDKMKVEILDDPGRKAELKKIIDIYQVYTMTTLGEEYDRLMILYTWLEDNGYL